MCIQHPRRDCHTCISQINIGSRNSPWRGHITRQTTKKRNVICLRVEHQTSSLKHMARRPPPPSSRNRQHESSKCAVIHPVNHFFNFASRPIFCITLSFFASCIFSLSSQLHKTKVFPLCYNGNGEFLVWEKKTAQNKAESQGNQCSILACMRCKSRKQKPS